MSAVVHSILVIIGTVVARWGRMPSRVRRRYEHRCIHCGSAWTSQRRNASCCKRCSTKAAANKARDVHFAAYAERHGVVAPREAGISRGSSTISWLSLKKCSKCHVEFLARNRVKYCSERCKRSIEYGRYYARTYEKKAGPLRIITIQCVDCGLPIERLRGPGGQQGPKRYCGRCRSKRVSLSRSGRTHRHRARKYGCRIAPVHRVKVFDRDGWHCRNCRCATPRELMGTCDDNAPELDHVVPLSRGGAHAMDNVQCLCRVCNLLKGTLTMTEFSLKFAG